MRITKAIGLPVASIASLFLGLQSHVLVAQESSIPRALGTLEVRSGPSECSGDSCYEVRVACPDVRVPARAALKVSNAPGTSDGGTVLFTTGGLGTDLYERQGSRSVSILEAAQSAGFRTVQIQWIDSWLLGSEGSLEGHVALACRPATVAQWVHDNLASESASAPYCATGHSGGAAQISYMLSHYGLEGILNGVVPTGGPPMARMDLSCDRDNSFNADVAYPVWAANIIDAGFGFLPTGDPSDFSAFRAEGSGPCSIGDETFFDELRAASVVSENANFHYPATMVSFVFEGTDNTNAVSQGRHYLRALENAKSPHVDSISVPGVNHGTLYTADQGVQQIKDALLRTCQIWE